MTDATGVNTAETTPLPGGDGGGGEAGWEDPLLRLTEVSRRRMG